MDFNKANGTKTESRESSVGQKEDPQTEIPAEGKKRCARDDGSFKEFLCW